MNRGEIYYVSRPESVGAEMQAAGRPAIVVSRQSLVQTLLVQQVVFLTTREKPSFATHVTVTSTGRLSTAICEQVTSVSVERFGDLCGVCTPEEMKQIDKAIAYGLGINPTPEIESATDGECEDDTDLAAELLIAETQRDTYREMYERLLHRILNGGGF